MSQTDPTTPKAMRRRCAQAALMRFHHEFEIPLSRPDARILVRVGGRPVQEYAVMLQIQLEQQWRTIRLIDNHLDQHHMHH
jgi:hypothetical protein